MNFLTLTFSITFWLLIQKKYGSSVMSTIHATTAVILSLILWTFYIHEEHLVSIMVAYFISDLYNVFKKKQYDMIFHHIFCTMFILYIHKLFPHDNIYESNALSKLVLLEISTPFLNMYKSTKKPIYGVMLLITFFLSRIMWLTYIFVKSFYGVPFDLLGYRDRIFFMGFVLLNYWWYMKIVRIAYYKYTNSSN